MTLATRKSYSRNAFGGNPYPLKDLQFYADLWNVEQQGYALSFDGNDKVAATVADFRSADSLGTYELTPFRSSSTANNQTLFASCDIGTTTSFLHIYVALTTGRLTISTQNAAGTVNTCSGTLNNCDGKRHTLHVKSSGTAWSFLVDGVLDTPIVVAGSNTGDWFADITLRDNVTEGVQTTTGDGSWAIAVMGQHRIYSVALSDAECMTNHQRGWKSSPFDETYLVYWLRCNEGTGNPVDSVGAVNGTITGATWIESLIDRSLNAYPISSFGSPVWSNLGRTLASGNYLEATATALNFTTSDFSVFMWIYPTSLTIAPNLFCRGLYLTDGYRTQLGTTGSIIFDTYQAAARQQSFSAANAVIINKWQFVGFTRAGAVGKVWADSVNKTTTSGTHINPTTSTRTLKIGIYDDKVTEPFIGRIALILVYSRVLSQVEITQIYLTTKWRYGL